MKLPSAVVLRSILHTLSQALADRVRRVFRRATRSESRLRIGVDIRPFYEPLTGIGWYLYHLLHEIAKHDDVELFLFGDARVTDLGPALHAVIPPNAHLCWFDLRGRGKISRPQRAITAAAYVLWMALIDCDVMFGANYFLPRLLGATARRRVITIHDLTYKRHPELLQKETLHNLETHMAREIAAADAIICVSESTREDLLRFYQMDPRRAIAIHSGVSIPTTDNRQPTNLPKRYILFVSTIEPRKNLGVLLDAFEGLKARGAYDGALVVVGRVGWKSEELVDRLNAGDVHHLDYLEPDQLADVYRNAELFVFPSIYEGFGFPLLEAMTYGVPSIAARSSSLPEIGGDATVYFDPGNARELESAIERLLGDAAFRQEVIARGKQRVTGFRWDDTAEKTLEVLRRVT
jgi:glycosyltransferase involved in cell wall biosynthesis